MDRAYAQYIVLTNFCECVSQDMITIIDEDLFEVSDGETTYTVSYRDGKWHCCLKEG